MYQGKGDQSQNIEIYEDIGRSILISLLDLEGSNPYSWIVTSEFGDLKGVKEFVERQI